MIGTFIVDYFKDEISVIAKSKMNEDILGLFFLPPLNRENTSNIVIGSLFFGILDEESGLGALLVGFEEADFQHKFEYDLDVNGSIQATNDIKAGSVSLKDHIHSITGLQVQSGGVVIGSGAGVTDSPIG